MCCVAAEHYELVRALHAHHGFVNALALNPGGTVLALAGDSGGVTLWDVATGHLVRTLDDGAVYAVAFDPIGHLLATGGLDGTSKVWIAATGGLLHSFRGHSGWINALVFAAGDRQLATAGRDGTVRIWDTAGGIPRVIEAAASYSLPARCATSISRSSANATSLRRRASLEDIKPAYLLYSI